MPGGDGTGLKGKGPVTVRGQGGCKFTGKAFWPKKQNKKRQSMRARRGRGAEQGRGRKQQIAD